MYEFANPPPAPGVIGTDAEDVAEYVDAEFDWVGVPTVGTAGGALFATHPWDV